MNTISTHPDFDFPVNYSVAVLPDTADAQVAATIDMMRGLAVKDSKSPVFCQALLDFHQLNDFIGADPCRLAYLFAKSLMRFQRDEITGDGLADNTVEVLVRPVDAVMLREQQGDRIPGDCDCFSMTVAAALLAQQVPCSFVTVAGDKDAPMNWSHVYVVAWPGDFKRRCAIDASHGAFCGWEAPDAGRYQEWPLLGGSFSGAVVLGFVIALLGVLAYLGDKRS